MYIPCFPASLLTRELIPASGREQSRVLQTQFAFLQLCLRELLRNTTTSSSIYFTPTEYPLGKHCTGQCACTPCWTHVHTCLTMLDNTATIDNEQINVGYTCTYTYYRNCMYVKCKVSTVFHENRLKQNFGTY